MKKFGTPIGAGPGSASENVGFPADGTPPEPRNGGLGECDDEPDEPPDPEPPAPEPPLDPPLDPFEP
jgi:hypothetical protein